MLRHCREACASVFEEVSSSMDVGARRLFCTRCVCKWVASHAFLYVYKINNNRFFIKGCTEVKNIYFKCLNFIHDKYHSI